MDREESDSLDGVSEEARLTPTKTERLHEHTNGSTHNDKESRSSHSTATKLPAASLSTFLSQEKHKQPLQPLHDQARKSHSRADRTETEEEEDDGCCTLSTSSMAESLTPDNPPLFPSTANDPKNIDSVSDGRNPPLSETNPAILSHVHRAKPLSDATAAVTDEAASSQNSDKEPRNVHGSNDVDTGERTKKSATSENDDSNDAMFVIDTGEEEEEEEGSYTPQDEEMRQALLSTIPVASSQQLLGQHHKMHSLPSTIAEESTHGEESTTEHDSSRPGSAWMSLQRQASSMNDLPALASKAGEPSSSLPPVSAIDTLAASQERNGSFSSPASLSSSPLTVHTTTDITSTPTYTTNISTSASNQPHVPEMPFSPSSSPLRRSTASPNNNYNSESSPSSKNDFVPYYTVTRILDSISKRFLKQHYGPLASATWIGFWCLGHVTCSNYVLTPMRDAIALAVGVEQMPRLTLASTVLAFCSSVPIGWLFEAPDPNRRRLFKRMGLTRGETQGTSLALFYRCFAFILLSYAIGFPLLEWLKSNERVLVESTVGSGDKEESSIASFVQWVKGLVPDVQTLLAMTGQILYIAFFLIVHLMKLHSISLAWGVISEAMEYEEVARKKQPVSTTSTTRLQRLALIGFGGTLGGILGSVLASSLAQVLFLPGLLVLASLQLEISAELSIELGRIMEKHWIEQQVFQSTNDLSSLDTSMRRVVSLGSMKRVASGNSLNRVKSANELKSISPSGTAASNGSSSSNNKDKNEAASANDNTFLQRLLRGATTILNSRLLMAIFTYNALYASATTLVSFQRAALVANRSDTTSGFIAFLANINMASSVAIFALQASGLGASLAQYCGPQGTLALMPLTRLAGVLALAYWHHVSQGQPPNLLVFLVVDECCKIMNLAVAKPVRESLWRGLSNEARYEAKPIVDTLANRWGGGSAAFLVSTLHNLMDLFGVPEAADGSRTIFGFPPILFLCMIIAAWWAVVSADLGQIRKRIDSELKKRQ